ncbi:MAG TPA: hypothetical protein VJ697_16860 [Nitrososphaeraceae archaeon]|nr:hypothetical protein [Nitrososphaeraceae archaeon]
MEVNGSKEISDEFNNIQRETTPNVLLEWAEKIEQNAKWICNDPDCKRIKFKYTEESGFVFEISDKEAADCVIQAIQEYENSQSIIIREQSRVLIKDLEKTKKDLK